MAHAGLNTVNTGGSQFFVVLSEGNTKHLNGKHTVFGQTVKGLDVVKKIRKDDKMTKVTVQDVSEKIKNLQLKKM